VKIRRIVFVPFQQCHDQEMGKMTVLRNKTLTLPHNQSDQGLALLQYMGKMVVRGITVGSVASQGTHAELAQLNYPVLNHDYAVH